MIRSLAGSPALDALAWALVHFLWQSAAIALVLASVRPAIRTAAMRYAASCAALLAMAACLPLTFALLYTPAAAVSLPAAIALDPPPLTRTEQLQLALLGAWLTGALILSVRLAGGLAVLRRLATRDTLAVTGALRDRAERIAERLGVSRAFALLASPHVAAPLTFGWWKPVILVPAAALTSTSPELLEALLAHELAHLKRRDFLVNVLQTVVESVLFHSPAVWWVSAAIREEREYACDDLAVGAIGDRVTYASALASLAESAAPSPALASLSNGGPLVRRIRRLLAPSPVPSRVRALAAPIALVFMALPLAAFAVSAAFAPPDKGEAIAIKWLPPAMEPWRDEITAAAYEHGIDPDLLAIVVMVESGGNPDARSSSGAVGLMQVMPATAKKIAADRGEKSYDEKKLADPVYNLDAGAWFLAQQMKEFGSVEQAAAAYNGGPKAIRSGNLSDETIRYRALVGALWNDRAEDRSIALYGWRDRAIQRMSQKSVEPVPGARVSLPFQAMTPDLGAGAKPHEGLDLAIASGTEIRAPLAGRVLRAAENDGDRGTVLVLDHGNGIETRYHHLGTLAVKAGDRVETGAVVGTVGTTGKTTGPHLHMEVRDLGRPVDPMLVLPSPWREETPASDAPKAVPSRAPRIPSPLRDEGTPMPSLPEGVPAPEFIPAPDFDARAPVPGTPVPIAPRAVPPQPPRTLAPPPPLRGTVAPVPAVAPVPQVPGVAPVPQVPAVAPVAPVSATPPVDALHAEEPADAPDPHDLTPPAPPEPPEAPEPPAQDE